MFRTAPRSLVSVLVPSTFLLLFAVACATPEPAVQKVAARPLQPAAGEAVVVDQLYVIIDSSASLDDGAMFYQERALVESFVGASPDGDYQAGAVAFGGFNRSEIPLARFDRAGFQAKNAEMPYLESGTPLHKVLGETKKSLAGSKGRAAVVIFSDGVVTDEFGRDVDDERVVASASELVESYDGTVCLHTVQVGESESGGVLLRRISDLTECGSSRPASAVGSEAQLHALNREVFLGTVTVAERKLPAVAAAPPVPAQDRTRWSVKFGFDSANVAASYRPELGEIAQQVEASPGARVRIQGHTDSKGNVDYNRALSMRRAEATRDALVNAGVPARRIDVEGFGADAPLFADDSESSNAENRRTEIELVR